MIENFEKISMLRNPGLVNLLQRIDYIEKMGTGIARTKLSLKNAGIPDVKYEISQTFFKTIFTRVLETTLNTTHEAAQEAAQETTREILLRHICDNPSVTRKELAWKIGLTEDGVKYHMNKLKQEGILKHKGSTKKGEWQVTGVKGAL